jgi:hypothetical protein
MPFTLSVEQEHIAAGIPKDEECCPIARALMARGLSHCVVNGEFARFSTDGSRYSTQLPDEAITFVHRFDNYMSVSPFEFQVRPIQIVR